MVSLIWFVIIFLASVVKGMQQAITTIGVKGELNSSINLGGPMSCSYGDKYFSYGVLISNSLKLLAEWINFDQHGINLNGVNHSFSITYIEDYSTIDGVIAAGNYLIQDGTQLFSAPYSYNLTTPLVEITEKNNRLAISGASAVPTVNSTLAFFALPSDLSRITTAFTQFRLNGAETVAVIRDVDNFNCLYNNTVSAAAATGMDLHSHTVTDPYSGTYIEELTSLLQQLQRDNVDTILACSLSALCLNVCLVYYG
jgi:hypothetical protein